MALRSSKYISIRGTIIADKNEMCRKEKDTKRHFSWSGYIRLCLVVIMRMGMMKPTKGGVTLQFHVGYGAKSKSII